MKRGSLWIALVVICALGAGACGSSHHHVTPIPTNNFVFYAAGTDSAGNTYSIAGTVRLPPMAITQLLAAYRTLTTAMDLRLPNFQLRVVTQFSLPDRHCPLTPTAPETRS
jgi:hypothetical protein